jgi:hypothetical protein
MMKLFHAKRLSAGLIAPACLALGCYTVGCASAPPPPAPAAQAVPTTSVRIVPAQPEEAPATIRKVDDTYHFVVVDFSSRAMPPVGTRLVVYRDGRPVGEVRITEPSPRRTFSPATCRWAMKRVDWPSC